MKFKLIVHPFIFTSYAVLALLASNTSINQLAGLRSLFFSLIVAIALLLILRLFLKDINKASLITSAFVLLWFSYGQSTSLIDSGLSEVVMFSFEIILLIIWVFIFIGCGLFVLKMKPRKTEQLSQYMNWTSLLLIFFPIYTLSVDSINNKKITPIINEYIQVTFNDRGINSSDIIHFSFDEGPRPDIYYIILDAYARSDVLDELYHYDNSHFVDFLKKKGFFVIDAARTNYTDTNYSIASSLNMIHINTIPDYFRNHAGLEGDWIVKQVSGNLIKRNRVAGILQGYGYKIVAFDSGYEPTRLGEADEYVSSPDIVSMTTEEIIFEMMLFDTSIGRLYMRFRGDQFTPLENLYDAHRNRILFTLENLPKFAELEGDYFVFAHILAPHPPFVFGPNGEEIHGNDPYTLLDVEHGKEEHLDLYSNQVNYLNSLVMETIDKIITKSDTQPIIILQSDHGSRVYDDVNPPDDIRMKLLVPILNAYYLPGKDSSVLYPSITPVNSFPLIFNEYFGSEIKYLEDTTYVLSNDNGKHLFEIACEADKQCISK